MAASLLSSKRLESDQREIRVNSNERLQQKITTIKGNAHMIVVSFIGWNEGEANGWIKLNITSSPYVVQ